MRTTTNPTPRASSPRTPATFEEAFGYSTDDFRRVMAQQAALSCFAELRFGQRPEKADATTQICHCVETRVLASELDWDGIRDAGPRAARFGEVIEYTKQSIAHCAANPQGAASPSAGTAPHAEVPQTPQLQIKDPVPLDGTQTPTDPGPQPAGQQVEPIVDIPATTAAGVNPAPAPEPSGGNDDPLPLPQPERLELIPTNPDTNEIAVDPNQ